MSAFSDNATITGDGSNSTTLALATKSVTNIADMQNYVGPATVLQVADPYQGGTFHYESGDSFLSGSLIFGDSTVALPEAHPGFCSVGQTIYITGTPNSDNDGRYQITEFDGTVITVASPAFSPETHAATISIAPFQNIFTFKYKYSETTGIRTVTIINSDYATSPSMGFLANGFYEGQNITVTRTLNFNGTFTIATVTENTITAFVTGSFPVSEFAVATLTDDSTYTTTSSLKFNSGGTAPTTINDDFSDGLYTHFRANQNIQISGTSLNNGVYKVLNVSKNDSTPPTTSQLVISSAFKATGTLPATITSTDGGLTFPAIGKGLGMWRRQYDPKDGLNVTWFGAKGDALRKISGSWYSVYVGENNNTPAKDNTQSIQQALNVAASNRLAINKVVIPPGMYLHRTLYVPSGVLLTGTGAIVESLGIATSRLVMKPGGGDSLRFISTGVDHGTISRRFWYGGVTNLEFLGEFANSTGWAISFSDPTKSNPTDSIAPQDMNFFENLMIRSYPEGGMNFPDCAVPLNVRNIKVMPVGGPAIFISNSKLSSGQSINLDNVSCDHNVGGGIWLDKLDDRVSVIITNLKSEGGSSILNNNLPDCQRNAIICTDCVNTPITIDNANHQNVSNVIGSFTGNPAITIANGADYTVTLNVSVVANQALRFYTTGKLPNNITAGSIYYTLAAAPANTPFKITIDHITPVKADSWDNNPGTTPKDTQSGIHLLYKVDSQETTSYEKPGDLVSIEKLISVSTFSLGGTITLTSSNSPSNAYPGTSGLLVNDAIKFYSTSGSPLPANIIPGRIYYVKSINSNTIEIAIAENNPLAIDTSIGNSTAQYRVYKQINPLDDGAKSPKINWRGVALRVRKNNSDPAKNDKGTDPFIIAKTEIPYDVSEGKLNITQQIHKSKVTFGPTASLSTPVINLIKNTTAPQGGDFWYDGTNLKFATSPTAIKSLLTVIDVPEQAYTGTITWAPALSPPPPATATIFPPSGTTNHSYQWTQVGKMVTVRFNLSYQTAGAGQTSCTLTFPSDLPAPLPPNGFSTGHTLYAGSAGFLTSLVGGIGVARCNIHSQGTGVNRLDVYFTGNVVPLAVLATITYWAA